jgi:hypothetical protein
MLINLSDMWNTFQKCTTLVCYDNGRSSIIFCRPAGVAGAFNTQNLLTACTSQRQALALIGATG